MRLRDAIKLHNEDEVTVKKTGYTMKVVDIEYIEPEQTSNNIAGLSVRLEDGNWYGYKEIA